ncbi:MAG: hypothetical protein EB053_06580 [Chlamydiae bacterium]|nr:hypothetical protein [Chlamydiota bacterium]
MKQKVDFQSFKKIKKALMKRIFLFICIILYSDLEMNGLSAHIDSKRKRNIYLDLGAFMGIP